MQGKVYSLIWVNRTTRQAAYRWKGHRTLSLSWCLPPWFLSRLLRKRDTPWWLIVHRRGENALLNSGSMAMKYFWTNGTFLQKSQYGSSAFLPGSRNPVVGECASRPQPLGDIGRSHDANVSRLTQEQEMLTTF